MKQQLSVLTFGLDHICSWLMIVFVMVYLFISKTKAFISRAHPDTTTMNKLILTAGKALRKALKWFLEISFYLIFTN